MIELKKPGKVYSNESENGNMTKRAKAKGKG
jgi:hypothetical protein